MLKVRSGLVSSCLVRMNNEHFISCLNKMARGKTKIIYIDGKIIFHNRLFLANSDFLNHFRSPTSKLLRYKIPMCFHCDSIDSSSLVPIYNIETLYCGVTRCI